MKSKRLLITFTLGLGLTLALLWLLDDKLPSHAAPAAELRVCPSGCTYSSIQTAVDAANPGDIIKVAAGIYTDIHARAGVTQVVYISKTVTIQGGYTTTNWTMPNPDTNLTTLDALKQGRVLYITGNISPTIDGLRITGGDATGLVGDPWGNDAGAGVYIVDAVAILHNSQVFSNTAKVGGGVYLYQSASMLNNNIIASNTAGDGGGLLLWQSSATLSGNTVASNTAWGNGGGLYLDQSPAILEGNIIAGNSSGKGGGLIIELSNATLINNVVADNRVYIAGSGFYIAGFSPRLLHTTIARNSGGDGSGVYITEAYGSYSTASLTNTILVSHSVGISVTDGNIAEINGVLWDISTPITVSQSVTATVTVQNQHKGDPAFAPDGYHLTIGSAAIDHGVDAGITTDIDGETRPARAGYDLGADELWHKICLPLVVRNFQP